MPELPEVEIARRNLERWWEGRTADEVVLLDDKLLVETDASDLVDALQQPLESADRRGKYLLMQMADGRTVMFHFRMTGKILCGEGSEPEYARLSWHVPELGWLSFVDMRRLGDARVFTSEQLADYESLADMGPDPLEMTADDWHEALPDGRRLVKTALLDQSIVAGLGNIAASELMWRLGLPPRAKCRDLTDQHYERLAELVPEYVEAVIAEEAGEEITYIEEDLEVNPFQVYRRDGEACPKCGAEIAKQDVGGRSTYYCTNCQADADAD